MNEDKATPKTDDIDREVADYYESLADEAAPAPLDRAVMREAKRALRADHRKGSPGAWFRPLAFVTTLALSLAIIIDLANLGVFDAPDPSSDAASSPSGRDVEQTPFDATTSGRSRQELLNEIKRQEKLPAAGDVAEPGAGRAAKLKAAPDPQLAEADAALETAPSALEALACNSEQTSTPERWWACIVSLRETGRDDAAELELDKLKERFPEFAPP